MEYETQWCQLFWQKLAMLWSAMNDGNQGPKAGPALTNGRSDNAPVGSSDGEPQENRFAVTSSLVIGIPGGNWRKSAKRL